MESAMDQQFRLRWNNHPDNMTDVLVSLYHKQLLCDVTLACKGELIRAHQTVLTACSPFFEDMLLNINHPHPIIILADINLGELKAVLEFMYKGEVNVSQNLLSVFLKTAEVLRVKGLTDNNLLNDKGRQSGVPAEAGSGRRSHSPAPHEKRKRKSSNCDTNSNSDSRHNDSQATSNYKSTHLPKSQNERDVGSPDDIMPSQLVKQEPPQGSPQHIDSYHSMSEGLQTNRGRAPPGHDTMPPTKWYDASAAQDGAMRFTQSPSKEEQTHELLRAELLRFSSPSSVPTDVLRRSSRQPLPMPPELSSQRKRSASPGPAGTAIAGQSGKRGTRFRNVWLEQYAWLKFDADANLMYCMYCRKWSSHFQYIRTSFSTGNSNFRLEIINHHDKCKAHQQCVHMESKTKLQNFTGGSLSVHQDDLLSSHGMSDHNEETKPPIPPLDATDTIDGSKAWHMRLTFDKLPGGCNLHRCKLCGKIVTHIRNHYHVHFPGRFECPLCRATYTRSDNLRTHCKFKHPRYNPDTRKFDGAPLAAASGGSAAGVANSDLSND